jgi:Ca2+-binding EF-hand superfamily protein
MLCIDYPSEIVNGILKMIDKKEKEVVDFDEFLSAIKTIMLYDNYFEEMEPLFKYLDTKKQNKISKNHLVDSVAKLRQYQEKHGNQSESDNAAYLRCELRIPSEEEIE